MRLSWLGWEGVVGWLGGLDVVGRELDMGMAWWRWIWIVRVMVEFADQFVVFVYIRLLDLSIPNAVFPRFNICPSF